MVLRINLFDGFVNGFSKKSFLLMKIFFTRLAYFLSRYLCKVLIMNVLGRAAGRAVISG